MKIEKQIEIGSGLLRLETGHLAKQAQAAGTPVIQLPVRNRPVSGPNRIVTPNDLARRVTPLSQPSSSPEKNDGNGQDLSDMEIPTFIRRQMD